MPVAATIAKPIVGMKPPIQPLPIGDSANALAVSKRLEAGGFFVPAVRPPTVPEGGARLRVTLSAAHAEADVEGLLDALMTALAAEAGR